MYMVHTGTAIVTPELYDTASVEVKDVEVEKVPETVAINAFSKTAPKVTLPVPVTVQVPVSDASRVEAQLPAGQFAPPQLVQVPVYVTGVVGAVGL